MPLKKTRYLSEEAISEIKYAMNLLKNDVNCHLIGIQDNNIVDYLGKCDELDFKTRMLIHKIYDIIDYCKAVDKYCTGGYDINDI